MSDICSTYVQYRYKLKSSVPYVHIYKYISLQVQFVHMKPEFSSMHSALVSNDSEALAVIAVFFEVSADDVNDRNIACMIEQ